MKTNNHKTEIYPLLLAASGMELSWLIAVFILFMNLASMPLLIMPQVIIVFLLSALITFYASKKNYKLFYHLIMHFIFISFIVFYTLSVVNDYFSNAANLNAFETFLAGPNTIWEGFIWALTIIVVLIFHTGGISLARRELSYRNIAARFDVGITVFILTFIVAGAAGLTTLSIMALTFAFFILSLPAIAMARYRQADTKGEFLHKYRSSAPILIFTAFTLILGSGIALLFYPLLLQAASAGQGILVHYGRPVADLFARIIVFTYSLRSRVNNAPSNGLTRQDNIETYSSGGEQAGLPEQVLFWVLIIFVAAGVIIALFYVLRLLINWLSSDSKANRNKPGMFQVKLLFKLLQKVLIALWFFAASLARFIKYKRNRMDESEPTYIFLKLSAWGAKSGRPRIETETPLEYTKSLQNIFPALDREIALIADIINREIYGGVAPGMGEKSKLNQSWRKLRSPAFWPARLKSRLLNSDL